jgi:hypothetical protein
VGILPALHRLSGLCYKSRFLVEAAFFYFRTKAACHNMPGGTLRERWLVRDVTSLIATLKYAHNVTHPERKNLPVA